MLEDLVTLLSVAMPLALMISLWVMAQISRRFGEVTHRPPLYRWFYLALGLLTLPLGVRLLAIGLPESDQDQLGGNNLGALLHNLPLALAIVIALVIAWRYWGWLVYAREGESPVNTAASGPESRREHSNPEAQKQTS